MSDLTYPAELAIAPLAKPPNATITVPGSKSITNRALVLAALCSRSGKCVLNGALWSEDTEVMVGSLRKLGFGVVVDRAISTITIARTESERIIPAESADLFISNSGTSMRFLTAMVSLGQGRYRLDGIPRMRERPIRDLTDALLQLRINARSENDDGCPPVVITTSGWPDSDTNFVTIRAGVSSQFLSALLLTAPFGWGTTTIRVEGPRVSEPYISLTVSMAWQWGLCIPEDNAGGYEIPSVGGPGWAGLEEYTIEPDASAASYFWAAAAITGGRVMVAGLNRKSIQGDVRFVDVLQEMGCRVEECDAGITVHGGPLRGLDVDMNDISDTVMTLGAVACFAEGPTTIRNVAHIRHKETDRIAALATELRKLGAAVEERPDGLTIIPRPLKGCAVDTYNDHRMAMSLALIGLKVPGVVIRNPGCVAKTYPGFWKDLEKLRT